MNCHPIPEREDWFITDRKPTICPHCGAGFWKDTPRNKAALGGLVPWQWPPEERTEKEKAKLMWKWFQEWKKNQVF